MPVFNSSDQLIAVLKSLFQDIGQKDPSAADSVSSSKMIIRIVFTDPDAELTINARVNPIKFTYGSTNLRPDFDVQMSADAFHNIMLGELPLRKAVGSGQLKVKGPIYKSFALADIFKHGQAAYRDILNEQALEM
jgi:putative sterol carrier protein